MLAHELVLAAMPTRLPEEQHTRYRWSSVAELLTDVEVHDYVKRYF